MRRHTKTALGIDITERRINAVLIEKHEDGFRTVAAASGDLCIAEPAGGRPPQIAGVLQVLRRLGRAVRVRGIGMKTAVAVSADSMVVQILDMPRQAPTNVGEFVESELRQYVALSGKTIVSDFCGVGMGPGLRRRLLAAAAEAAQVCEKVAACSRAGAAVGIVEPAVLAYARAFLAHHGQELHGCTTIIAMLDVRSLTICAFAGITLDFVRVRAVPAGAESAEPLCAWLMEELRAVRRFYEARALPTNRGSQARVVMHDDTCAADDVKRLIAAEAGMEWVTVVNSCEPIGDPQGPQEASMVAVGAALRLLDADGDDLRVNLLPGEVVRERLLSRHMLVTANAVAVVFLGIFLATQLLARTTEARNRRIEQMRLSEELYTAPALMAEEKFVDQRIEGLRWRLGPLRRAIDGKRDAEWPGILEAIRRATPPDVRVTQWLCEDGRRLSLQGAASSCDIVQAFVQHLESEGVFASVLLARIDRRQDGDTLLEYQIDCLLRTR